MVSKLSPPSISVIIPTYNRASFLHEAIESVRAQSFESWELLIVDDGSTDETGEVLSNYKSDPRIKVIRQENFGVSHARNRGLEKAQGEWIAFLDSDDTWLPNKLEVQWETIRRDPNLRILQTDEIWIRNGRRVNPMKKYDKPSGWIFESCLPLCIISPSTVLIHREVFGRCGSFDESLLACEDYDLWLRVCLEYPVLTLPEKLTIKRGGHDDQLSRQWGLDRYRLQALRKILKHPRLSPEQRNLVETNLEFRYKVFFQGAAKRGKII